MMKLSTCSRVMLRSACTSQKQFASPVAQYRKLHVCTIRNSEIRRFLSRNVLDERGGLLRSCFSHTKLLKHWESTLSTPTVDMNKDLHCVHVNACSQLYHKWYEMDVSRKMPLRGVDFDVVYFDSKPRAPSHIPVIVALHGTAGSHLNFESLVPILMESGARILIPNFPGCGFTLLDKERAFLHTDQERASFVMEFLNTLGVSRVDVLIVHSAAIYPALYCLNDIFTFKSIVFVNPGGHKPIKALQPVWLSQIAISLLSTSLLRPLARWILPKFVPNMKLEFEQLIIAAKSMAYVNFDFVVSKLKDLKLMNYPMTFTYAMNDNVVDVRVSEEMAEILEFSPNEIVRYDSEGKLEQPQNGEVSKQRPLCIIFEDGGHFVMKAYPDIVGKAIADLLALVKR